MIYTRAKINTKKKLCTFTFPIGNRSNTMIFICVESGVLSSFKLFFFVSVQNVEIEVVIKNSKKETSLLHCQMFYWKQ